MNTAEARRDAADELRRIATSLPVGTVIERRSDPLRVRAWGEHQPRR
ncbi:hypothetical protein [Prauserella marina]